MGISSSNKTSLRTYYLDLRNKLPTNLKKQHNLDIFKHVRWYLLKHFWKRKIAIYWSLEYEVDTKKIIIWLLKHHYKVYLPKIIDKQSAQMQFVNINDLAFESELVYNIKQPKTNQYVDPKSLDVVFVPLVCFDKNHNRIGMGKGYYDHFLKQTYATKIGLAYQVQQYYFILSEQNDVKLDKIITENGEN